MPPIVVVLHNRCQTARGDANTPRTLHPG
jgi:hypothetical protein